MSPRSSANGTSDDLNITLSNDDELLFTSILDKNLNQFAKSGAIKTLRSASLEHATNGASVAKRQCSRRSVNFGSVSTREYDRIVGDNPSCRSGPPLGLGWNYSSCEEISIDSHQLKYQIKREKKRPVTGNTLYPVTERKRESILKTDWGYTDEELQMSQDEIIRIQWERYNTIKALQILEKAKALGASCKQTLKKVRRSVRRT